MQIVLQFLLRKADVRRPYGKVMANGIMYWWLYPVYLLDEVIEALVHIASSLFGLLLSIFALILSPVFAVAEHDRGRQRCKVVLANTRLANARKDGY